MKMVRRLDDSGTTGQLVVVAAAGLLAAMAVVVTASPGGFVSPGTALAFTAFVALGEVVRITLPGGRDAAPIAMAGSLAYALLVESDGAPADHGPLQVVAVVTVAMLFGVIPHIAAGRAPAIDSLARR
ncbi:MAG: phosphohydrolase, partial [Actinomycetes bacterium]